MSDLFPKSFDIDSSLELVADHWTAEVPDSSLFRNASLTDRVTLKAGLLDANNNPQIITAIVDAKIDEYQMVIRPNELVCTIRGRDASSAVLDSYFTKLYARTAAALAQSQGQFAVEVVPGSNAVVTPTLTQIGNFKASQIAQDAVASVGLLLNWQIRDYEIQAPMYNASGTIVDILRKLIRPWILVDPFRVDMTLVGTTVTLQHRALPNVAIVPQYIFTAAAARRSGITIRRRPMRKLGIVTLRGMKNPLGLGLATKSQIKAGSGVYVSGDQTVTLENDFFDGAGNAISTVVTEETYRMPDRIVTQSIKETSTLNAVDPSALSGISGSPGAQLQLVSRDTIVNDWEDSLYEGTTVVNAPKQLSQTTYQEGIDRANDPSQLFRLLNQFFTQYTYDNLGFKTGEVTTKQKFDFDAKNMTNDQQIIKTLHDVGSLLCEEVTDIFKWDATNNSWAISQHLTAISGGHRPGGPGRGIGRGATSGDPHVTLQKQFSTDKDAQNVDFADDNLSLADLQFIMDQFAATVGMTEYEFQFSGVAMPWLKRGMTIQFVDLPMEDGSTIALTPSTTTEVRTRYLEKGAGDSVYTIDVRAFGWSTS